MSLDLASTATQVDGMAAELKARQSDRDLRLRRALEAIRDFPVDAYDPKRGLDSDAGAWGVPAVLEPPDSAFGPSPLPPDFTVAAVDGSHIDVDRNLAARCFLINTGAAVLTYGSAPAAELLSEPRLYARSDELVIRDPVTYREQAIEGAILGARRNVEEIRTLADVVKRSRGDRPTLALLDGSLLMLGLVGHGYEDFVRRELIEDGFVAGLVALRELAESRTLAVASYISLPGHFEVVNALRHTVCEYGEDTSEKRCGLFGRGGQPCDRCVGGVLDREIFARLLAPGERSGLFASSSGLVERHYKGNEVDFFYVNVGEEIGRVEVPSWVADDEELLALAHALVVDQCDRGRGYPVGLMEAHEQAVVSAGDRRYFVDLVERTLHDRGVPVRTSEKERSKRLRWL